MSLQKGFNMASQCEFRLHIFMEQWNIAKLYQNLIQNLIQLIQNVNDRQQKIWTDHATFSFGHWLVLTSSAVLMLRSI